jgi:hypothetical protein
MSQRTPGGCHQRLQSHTLTRICHEIGILTIVAVMENVAILGRIGNFGSTRVASQVDRIAITMQRD